MSSLNFAESRFSSVGSVKLPWSINAWRVLKSTKQACVDLLGRFVDRIWVWGERAMENSRANALAADELSRLLDSKHRQSNDAVSSFVRRKAGSIG